MEILKDKIQRKEEELVRLKEELILSFDSVKECWTNTYHNSFSDKCKMIYYLAKGRVFKPYDFSVGLKIERAKEWKKEIYFDYSDIYKGFGSPIGFISLESGLFDATADKHKKMWLTAIKDKKEERSFEEFRNQLKTDVAFLLKTFENCVKESGSGVYSTDNYMIVYEEKRLKTGKYYIYLEGTSRKI